MLIKFLGKTMSYSRDNGVLLYTYSKIVLKFIKEETVIQAKHLLSSFCQGGGRVKAATP